MSDLDLNEEEEDSRILAELEKYKEEEEEAEEEDVSTCLISFTGHEHIFQSCPVCDVSNLSVSLCFQQVEKATRRWMGATKVYCPVVLREKGTLVPCTDEFAAKYRDKVYYLSSTEAREKFLQNPAIYSPPSQLLKVGRGWSLRYSLNAV